MESIKQLSDAVTSADPPSFFETDLALELDPPSKASCTVLFPMKKAFDRIGFDIGAAGAYLTSTATDVLDALVFAKENQCEVIVDNRERIIEATRGMLAGGLVTKKLGGYLENRKDKDINVAIWGWAGFTIKAARLKKIGGRLSSLSENLQTARLSVTGIRRQCELEVRQLQILENQAAILRGQQSILDIIPGEPWYPPGQVGR